MNTRQKDIDALNWSIVGPKLLECLKEIIEHDLKDEDIGYYDTCWVQSDSLGSAIKKADLLIKEAEAINV